MSEEFVDFPWGYIGKIPVKGDFIKSNLSEDFSISFYEWLQTIIAISKEQLGSQWESFYLTAPVWNFSLAANLFDEHCYIGSLIPSVDSSGRYFFFCIVKAVEGCSIDYWNDRAKWSKESERLALAVLEDNFSFDTWNNELINSGNKVLSHKSIDSECIIYKSDKHCIYNDCNLISSVHLLKLEILDKYKKPCLWWSEGNEVIEPSIFITSSLPKVGKFSAMLDGNWSHWGW